MFAHAGARTCVRGGKPVLNARTIPALEKRRETESYYDLAGGRLGVQRLAAAFYTRLFADEVLLPRFANPGGPEHAKRMALWLAEALGGPAEYSRRRGFSALVVAHHTRTIIEEQRMRWLGHMHGACDDMGLPGARCAAPSPGTSSASPMQP